MTTFTAWKFDTPDGADEASTILSDAARRAGEGGGLRRRLMASGSQVAAHPSPQ